MTLNYFYGNESEQFTFYRIPKVLFTDPKYQGITAESKILYGILLDRMSLSARNGWLDKSGRVYIIFTVEQIMSAMGCGNQKVGRLLNELEKKAELIERKRQGLGKPNLIYVKKFLRSESAPHTPKEKASDEHKEDGQTSDAPAERPFCAPDPSHFMKCENHISESVNNTPQEVSESHGNNTDSKQTDKNDTDSFPFTSFREPERKRQEPMDRNIYREIILENIEYDILIDSHPTDLTTLDEIVELLVDAICTTKPTIRISGDDKPADIVRSQFLKLTSEHIGFVLDNLSQNTTRIRNIKQYLLATLYNAPMTMENYYRSLVSHDMAEGRI